MMELRVSGFDWDEGNRGKCEKHGVAIAEIEALFVRAPHCVCPETFDNPGSLHRRGKGKYAPASVCGVHDTHKGQPPPHPPGDARYMHAKEVAAYEEEGPAVEE